MDCDQGRGRRRAVGGLTIDTAERQRDNYRLGGQRRLSGAAFFSAVNHAFIQVAARLCRDMRRPARKCAHAVAPGSLRRENEACSFKLVGWIYDGPYECEPLESSCGRMGEKPGLDDRIEQRSATASTMPRMHRLNPTSVHFLSAYQ
jgi:hypothetical protein